MGATRRAPVLVPSPRGWVGRSAVRRLRVRVDDRGALVVERPDGTVERRAERGEVTRVLHVSDPAVAGVAPTSYGVGATTGDEHGLLVVLAGDRPALAVRIAEWVPAPAPLDGRTAREVSGANALAAALGWAVEPGDAATIGRHAREIPAVLVSPHAKMPRAATAAIGAGSLALVVMFAAGAIGRYAGEPPLAAFDVLGALGAAALTATWLFLRQRAATSLPDPPGIPVAPVPAGPVPAMFHRSRCYVSEDWLVLVDAIGREAWLPGPALGGVAQVAITTEGVVFDDAHGNGLAALPRAAWIGTPGAERTLRATLQHAGLRVVDEPSNRAPGWWLSDPNVTPPGDDAMYGALREARGVPGVAGGFGGAAALLVLIGGVTRGQPVAASIAGVTFAAAIGTTLRERVAARRDRSVR